MFSCSMSVFKWMSLCACVVGARALRHHHAPGAARRQLRTDYETEQLAFVIQLFIITVAKHEDTVFNMGMGSMITPQWVLTAAHNIDSVSNSDTIYVWFKNFTVSPLISNAYTKVRSVHKHPAFKMSEAFGMATNDICLLLTNKIPIEKYGRVLSMDYTSTMGLPATYVGRAGGGGAPAARQSEFPPLQVWEASVVPCDEVLRKARNYQICVSPKCSQRLNMPQYGDSGGPLLHDDKIIGVLTSGRVNGNKITGQFKGTYPMAFTGFTATSPYMDWLGEVLRTCTITPEQTADLS